MHFVEEDVIDRVRLAVGRDNGPADQLLLSRMQFAEDIHGSLVAHCWGRVVARLHWVALIGDAASRQVAARANRISRAVRIRGTETQPDLAPSG
jgi:hypothetical protein